MSSDEEYQWRAAECRRIAENVRSPLEKDAWLRMANSWLNMRPKQIESQSKPQAWPEPNDEDSKTFH
jgi:hypothetical protein